MGALCCAHSQRHYQLPQSDESDETGTEEDDYDYDTDDMEKKQELAETIMSQNLSTHFLFKRDDFMAWYTDDVSCKHTKDFIHHIKSTYFECDTKDKITGNRYLQIDGGGGHIINALSPLFNRVTLFQCSPRFNYESTSNQVRVIEKEIFDYFEPKQDLTNEELCDGFNLIVVHHILNTVQLSKWDILLSYLYDILSNNGLLMITAMAPDGMIIDILKQYIPNYQTTEYIMQYFTEQNDSYSKLANVSVNSWGNVTAFEYTESKAIEIYLEILEICFSIYDNKLFNLIKREVAERLKSDLLLGGFYSDERDSASGEYMVTVQLNDIHIAVRKN